MRVVVSTCDKYAHLLPGFAWCWNKYWGAPVDVLGFTPPAGLPDNFTFHRLAERETEPWSTHLRPWFEACEDERILFLFDDYWLIKPIDLARVAWMEGIVAADADKGDLSNNTAGFSHVVLTPDLVLATQGAQYRSSTQPAIWRRDYLLRLLQPGWNPWEFELTAPAGNDGARIVGPVAPIISMGHQYANMYWKGKWHHIMVEKIPPEDRAELVRLGHMPKEIL